MAGEHRFVATNRQEGGRINSGTYRRDADRSGLCAVCAPEAVCAVITIGVEVAKPVRDREVQRAQAREHLVEGEAIGARRDEANVIGVITNSQQLVAKHISYAIAENLMRAAGRAIGRVSRHLRCAGQT